METLQQEIQVSKFIKEMPKVELHAHLNGSLSSKTISKLYSKTGKHFDVHKELSLSSTGSLSDFFKMFDAIHCVTNTPEAIYTATVDVISDFYNDGVRYLELRSTPREIEGTMSQSSYVDAMLSAIKAAKDTMPDIVVKLLLSINRKSSLSYAEETVRIAESLLKSNSPVVGIDLSGNPSAGYLSFLPVLQYAKKVGLKISLHIAEIAGTDEENATLLALQPDRIGHGTFLHPSKGGTETNFQTVIKEKIPLEMCLTSNIKSQTISSFPDHHLPLWMAVNHPCVICTDDKGVFDTTLSEEYSVAQQYFSISNDDLWSMSYNAIDYSFATTDEKHALKQQWQRAKNDLSAT